MANIINLDRVSKGYGAAGPLLTDVSLGLDDADRIGVVGLNGSGKTTLLRLLTGAEQPDAGRVTRRRDLRVAWLPQAVQFPPGASVRDVVLGTAWLPEGFAAEHEWAGDSSVRTVLSGLGLGALFEPAPGAAGAAQPDGLDRPVGPMSGGERRRIALAALLVRSADLLVLDEPTNHLDVAGIAWLAGWLATRRGAFIVVTHDRWFLDAVCERTWEVADRTVRAYDGGYAAWTLARAERQRLAAAAEARRQNLLRKEIAWLRRGPPARTSKPRFRIEAANALIADVPPPRDTVQLHRLATARLGRQVYELDGVELRAGHRAILSGLDWLVGPGDRIALLGANGAGKTTLLRLLTGEDAPHAGRFVTGATVRVGYLSQDLAELPATKRVLEAVEEIARRVVFGDRELSAAQLAELFGFTEGRLWTPVGDLSGGERRRLQLLRLLAAEPNVLLLDEPTNDLDTDTLAALEDLLDDWPGTLVVASHDRYLVERVTDTAYAMFGDGGLTHLPGGVSEYLERVGQPATGVQLPGFAAGPQPSGSGAGAVPASSAVDGSPGGGGSGGGQAPARVLSAGEARTARKELARLERQVGKLEQREERLHEELAAHATDYTRVAELDAQLRALRSEREQVELEWLTLAEQLPPGS